MIQVTSFYKFFAFDAPDLEQVAEELEQSAKDADLCGLLVIAPEGLNATIAGSPDSVKAFMQLLQERSGSGELESKFSFCESKPYRRFKVSVRDEIVTIGDPELNPGRKTGRYLDVEEWHEHLSSDEDFVLIDTRNVYETDLGAFKGATDPKLSNFGEFPDYVRNSGIPKDRKVLMYCTGGIRCEKASLEMERQGYEEVYQLHGGILKYLEKYPEGYFDGECFVFDHRVSVDGKLQPSQRYSLCPHCGNPGDQNIVCGNCAEEARVCVDCLELASFRKSCSKDCANRLAQAESGSKHIEKTSTALKPLTT
jgi:UPF0176 protein